MFELIHLRVERRVEREASRRDTRRLTSPPTVEPQTTRIAGRDQLIRRAGCLLRTITASPQLEATGDQGCRGAATPVWDRKQPLPRTYSLVMVLTLNHGPFTADEVQAAFHGVSAGP